MSTAEQIAGALARLSSFADADARAWLADLAADPPGAWDRAAQGAWLGATAALALDPRRCLGAIVMTVSVLSNEIDRAGRAEPAVRRRAIELCEAWCDRVADAAELRDARADAALDDDPTALARRLIEAAIEIEAAPGDRRAQLVAAILASLAELAGPRGPEATAAVLRAFVDRDEIAAALDR